MQIMSGNRFIVHSRIKKHHPNVVSGDAKIIIFLLIICEECYIYRFLSGRKDRYAQF